VPDTVWADLRARLHAFVARRVPDRFAVDHLAQEIMLRLYSQIGRLRERDRLDAWAYQVARNAIADYWRDRAASRELPLDDQLSERLASLPERERDDEAEAHRAELARCLARSTSSASPIARRSASPTSAPRPRPTRLSSSASRSRG
jgi:RNA polymerase sigma factor (sigma-70 family)